MWNKPKYQMKDGELIVRPDTVIVNKDVYNRMNKGSLVWSDEKPVIEIFDRILVAEPSGSLFKPIGLNRIGDCNGSD